MPTELQLPVGSLVSHPYAEIFPMLSPSALQELTADIAANGLHDPIILLDGEVLDGRNRLAACERADVEPRFQDYQGNDPLKWVISRNLYRRHLDTSQRAMVAANLANIGHGGNRKNQAADLPLEPSQSDAASSLNVSERSVRIAKKIEREGVPELTDAVLKGDVKLHKAVKLLDEPEDIQREAIEDGSFEAPKPHVANNSGQCEWYTPAPIIEAARNTMGSIDLDPASCPVANENVKASAYFDQDDDGRQQQWKGNVWLNPPYSTELIRDFIAKLCEELESGNVSSACLLSNNGTETQWFQSACALASAVCFPKGRIKFLGSDGQPAKTPLQGQAILYFGSDSAAFLKNFSPIGAILATSNE